MEMTNVPYTQEAITEYLTAILPDEGGEVEDWIASEFERFRQEGRKLPKTVSVRTLRFGWGNRYKVRGRHLTPFCGSGQRVLRNNKSIQ
jgi:hypothetical protein